MSVLNIVLFCAAGFLLGIVISWLVSNIVSRIRNRTARRRVEPQAAPQKKGIKTMDLILAIIGVSLVWLRTVCSFCTKRPAAFLIRCANACLLCSAASAASWAGSRPTRTSSRIGNGRRKTGREWSVRRSSPRRTSSRRSPPNRRTATSKGDMICR